MQQRRDEILAKKAKLAELKRQRELRATTGRQSIGNPSEVSIQKSLRHQSLHV
jgi:dynein intermediate chain